MPDARSKMQEETTCWGNSWQNVKCPPKADLRLATMGPFEYAPGSTKCKGIYCGTYIGHRITQNDTEDVSGGG